MSEPGLFDWAPSPSERPPDTADRRRTLRRQNLLDQKINPATRRPLLVPPGHTCKDCSHHIDGRFHKCEIAGVTGGAGTDIRVSWPACDLFKPTEENA